jgi:hypothetical protein
VMDLGGLGEGRRLTETETEEAEKGYGVRT